MPGDEDRIKSQIGAAERLIEQENSQHDRENQLPGFNRTGSNNEDQPATKRSTSNPLRTVGPGTNEVESPASQQDKRNTNTESLMEPETGAKTSEITEMAKEQGDDGDEMVEGEEDTVIY